MNHVRSLMVWRLSPWEICRRYAKGNRIEKLSTKRASYILLALVQVLLVTVGFSWRLMTMLISLTQVPPLIDQLRDVCVLVPWRMMCA